MRFTAVIIPKIFTKSNSVFDAQNSCSMHLYSVISYHTGFTFPSQTGFTEITFHHAALFAILSR